MELWGILSPDDIPSSRRLQSLGLTRAIRRFNDRAAPGIGGLWFTMPLIWSMLGIAIAQKLERRPITVANAIEALAMKLALEADNVEVNPRVKGRRNLSRIDGHSYNDLRRQGAYVTQPFRQTCTQPLATLSLVEGTSARFNSFRISRDGERLLALLPGVREETENWVDGRRHDWDVLSAILPTATLPPPLREDLTRRIFGGGADAERRKAIRDTGARLTSQDILDGIPEGIRENHLVDLRGGIATVRLREAAVKVLGAVENEIAARRDAGHPPALRLAEADSDEEIRERIAACLVEADQAAPHIDAAGEEESRRFLRECQSPNGLLQRLAKRDGVVIVLRDDALAPGPAFGSDGSGDEEPVAARSGVPELPRIANLLALTDDLDGRSTRPVDDEGVA